ncbi:MAG: putative salt-induced outer membrane protein YdiY [Arenicella sp.]|jgi:putative salt-induced outer membrane protein YdiY
MKHLLLLLLLSTLSSYGQIVNIENKRLSENKQGFTGSIDLNLNFTMNAKELFQIGDKLRIGYLRGQHHGLVVTDHSFVKSKDDSFINQGYEHLRYNYRLTDSSKVSFEAFQQGQFNKIQKINLRLLLGTGFRFNLIDQENYQLSAGTGFMGEYEELIDNGSSADILSTSYVSFDGQFSESVGMNTITYLQPKILNAGFYRFSNETYFRFKINKYLSFKLVYSITHDNRDIEGIRKTNYTLRNTLSFNF